MSEIERTSVTTWKRDEREEEKKGEYNIQKKKGRRKGRKKKVDGNLNE